jgi:hypothetical protein
MRPLRKSLTTTRMSLSHTDMRCESLWELATCPKGLGGGTRLYRYSIGYQCTPSQAPCYDRTQP